MDKYLKRYFWVLHIVLIVLIALLAALTVSNLMSGALAPLMVTVPPAPDKKATKSSAGSARPTTQLDPDQWSNPAKPDDTDKNEEEAQPEEEEEVQIAEGEYPLSDLAVGLDGTLVAANPNFSMAMLSDSKSKATFFVGEGDTFGEETVEVVKIERDRILVKRNGQVEQIDLEGEPGKGGARTTARRSPLSVSKRTPVVSKTATARLSSSAIKGVTKKSANAYEVDRNVLKDVLADPAKFRKGANARPYRKGGKFSGFEITSVGRGSLLGGIGLERGDVITSVNGRKLNSMNVALDLYQKLGKGGGSLDGLSIEVERDGKQQKINYSVK